QANQRAQQQADEQAASQKVDLAIKQAGLSNMQDAAANKKANVAAMSDPSFAGGTQSVLSTDASQANADATARALQPGASEADTNAAFAGPQATTVATQPNIVGQYTAAANAADQRGDTASADMYRNHLAAFQKMHQEGVVNVAKSIYSGTANPAQIEQAYNSSGQGRVIPGSTTISSDGTLSAVDASTGQPITMTKDQAEQLLTLNGTIKPSGYTATSNGQVFNKDTGELTGTPMPKDIVVNGQIVSRTMDANGNAKYTPQYTAPKQFNPNGGGSGRGGSGAKTRSMVTDSAGNLWQTWSDGRAATPVAGADGKQLSGQAAVNMQAKFATQQLHNNPYGDPQTVANTGVGLANHILNPTQAKASDQAAMYSNFKTARDAAYARGDYTGVRAMDAKAKAMGLSQ
ncbi:MAG: hypothetical protein ABIT70_13020, partial [Sulfuriferula sp.]